jgi:hypothetical protein
MRECGASSAGLNGPQLVLSPPEPFIPECDVSGRTDRSKWLQGTAKAQTKLKSMYAQHHATDYN